MTELPHTKSCFVCGEANSHGLNLRFETDGERVRTRFQPRPEHVGFRHVVHGGIITTVLDEIMVWACAVRTRRFAFCAELSVRFVEPLRPMEAAIASAELTRDGRGRLFEAKADLHNEAGTLLATATGKYLPIKGASAQEMATDFVGDPSWLFPNPPG